MAYLLVDYTDGCKMKQSALLTPEHMSPDVEMKPFFLIFH